MGTFWGVTAPLQHPLGRHHAQACGESKLVLAFSLVSALVLVLVICQGLPHVVMTIFDQGRDRHAN